MDRISSRGKFSLCAMHMLQERLASFAQTNHEVIIHTYEHCKTCQRYLLTVNTFIRVKLIFIKVWDIEIRWNLQNDSLCTRTLFRKKKLHSLMEATKNQATKDAKTYSSVLIVYNFSWDVSTCECEYKLTSCI